MARKSDRYKLNWQRMDPEAKWCLPAKKFTGVNSAVSFFWGIIFTVVFYGILFPFNKKWACDFLISK